jgi:hypothetical protein
MCEREKEVCAICLGEFELCVGLPCGHQFCVLCIKGRSECAICKVALPVDFFDTLQRDLSGFFQPDTVYQRWAYSSRTQPGEWWLYLDSCSRDLSDVSSGGKVQLQILGDSYQVDFAKGIQRSMDGSRVRQIKRMVFKGKDVFRGTGVVGIAGVRHKSQ